MFYKFLESSKNVLGQYFAVYCSRFAMFATLLFVNRRSLFLHYNCFGLAPKTLDFDSSSYSLHADLTFQCEGELICTQATLLRDYPIIVLGFIVLRMNRTDE